MKTTGGCPECGGEMRNTATSCACIECGYDMGLDAPARCPNCHLEAGCDACDTTHTCERCELTFVVV